MEPCSPACAQATRAGTRQRSAMIERPHITRRIEPPGAVLPGFSNDPESDVEPVSWSRRVRRVREVGNVGHEAAALQHVLLARSRRLRIGEELLVVDVLDPLPHIAERVVEPPRVRLQLPNRLRGLTRVEGL